MKKHNWYLTVGVVITAVMVAFILVGMFWTPYDPTAMSSANK